MGKRLHDWVVTTWYGGTRRGVWLLPLAWVFAGVSSLRRALYEHGVFKRYRSSRLVVIIGNLTAGGTGKTPFVIWLAGELARRGLKVGVATRGYKGAHGNARRLTDVDSASDAGDEAMMIRRRLAVPVAVAPRRAEAVRLLEADCDVILCDDGLQHYALARDIEICVVDGRGYGNGFLMPAGPLREPPSRLRSVDAVVAHGAQGVAGHDMKLEGDQLVCMANAHDVRPAKSFAGQKVHAVAGIGDPKRFFLGLARFGMKPVPHPFPDHHPFVAGDLDFGDAAPVVMTEKDAVKCKRFAKANHWVFPVSASLDPAFQRWLLEKLSGSKAA